MGNSFIVRQMSSGGGGNTNVGWIDVPDNTRIVLDTAKLKKVLQNVGADIDTEFELDYDNGILLAAAVYNSHDMLYSSNPLNISFWPDSCWDAGFYSRLSVGNFGYENPEIEKPDIITFGNILDALTEAGVELSIDVTWENVNLKLCPIIAIQESSNEVASFYNISLSDFKSFIKFREIE